MPFFKCFAIISIALLAVTATTRIASAESIPQARLDAISAYMMEQVDTGQLAGIVTLIARDGQIASIEALGYRDLEDHKPMQKDSIFRIFSMTKPIVGTALMVLFDEGRFELDDPVQQYIPELKDLRVFKSRNTDGSFETEAAGHPMTIRELMSHTGGFVYSPPLGRGPITEAYGEVDLLDRKSSLNTMIAKLSRLPLNHQPGSRWAYSISVDVQGYLIEVLSGQTLDVFLEERIFKPLGMKDTAFYVDATSADRLARVYVNGKDGKLSSQPNDTFLTKPGLFSGGAGLTSTAQDYFRFAQMHLNHGELDGVRVISEKAALAMHTNQLPASITQLGRGYPGNVFGIDFAIIDDAAVNDGISKGSFWWWGIAGTWFWIDPEENIVFIGLIQHRNPSFARQIQAKSRQLIYGELPR